MASEPKIVDRSYAVADPQYPARVIKPNGPVANSPGIDGSVNVIIVGNIPVPTATTITDKSFDPDGNSNLIIAANANRIGYTIECPADLALNPNGNSLFIDIDSAASYSGTSFEITPGGSFPLTGMPLLKGDVFVKGDASIVKATAKEYT